MRMAAAEWCLRLALRLDPDLSLHSLAAMREISMERGMRGTWIVMAVFDDRVRAYDFTCWAHVFPERYPLRKDNQ